MEASINLEKIKSRVTSCTQAFVKRNGEKTSEPRIYAATNTPFYWTALKLFPENSIGGEDVGMLAICPSSTEPITLLDCEKPLVELVNPRIEITERGMTLVMDGMKRIKEGK